MFKGTPHLIDVKFSKAEPCPIHCLNPRWVSENGVWEIGVYPVMYGLRVRAGKVKNDWCTIDYCAGKDEVFLKQLLAVILIILETFDENTCEREVENILPFNKIKPLSLDPAWDRLKKIAMERRIRQAYASGQGT